MPTIDNVCVAGKNRIAIDTLMIVRRYFPDTKISAICNGNDDGTDMWQPSFRKFVKEENIDIVDLTYAQSIRNTLFMSVEFDKIIRTSLFSSSTILVNMHFSELPAYKGMYTSCLPILHGCATSGCTLHEMDDGIDTGPIIAQTRFGLDSTETAKTLYAKYMEVGASLVDETFPSIISGEYSVIEQKPIGSTYFSKSEIDYSNLKVDLRVTGEQLSRQIRAFNHRSYQLMSVLGNNISHCIVLPTRSLERPGTVLNRNGVETRVATIDFDCLLIHDRFEDAELAVMRNDTVTLQSLLARDPALVSETSARGWSLLARAAYNGCHRALATLIEYAADPNVTNGKGTTPLMYAKDRLLIANDPQPAAMLLAAGADLYRRDYRGKTVLDYMSIVDRPVLEALAARI